MPTFFNRDSLTVQQRRRWAWACAEYQRVVTREENRIAEVAGPEAAELYRLMVVNDPDNGIVEKSALFWRLLNGKPPMAMPPPTRYSYPWYGVLEQDGPFEVSFQLETPTRCDICGGEWEVVEFRDEREVLVRPQRWPVTYRLSLSPPAHRGTLSRLTPVPDALLVDPEATSPPDAVAGGQDGPGGNT